jgi:hypothetical protein
MHAERNVAPSQPGYTAMDQDMALGRHEDHGRIRDGGAGAERHRGYQNAVRVGGRCEERRGQNGGGNTCSLHGFLQNVLAKMPLVNA